MFTKPPKFNSKAVLAYVKSQTCLQCGASGSDPHHLPSPFGGTRRAIDIVVPLCRTCHDWFHQHPLEEKAKLPYFYSWALRTWVEVLDLSWESAWAGVVEEAANK